MKIEHMAMYVNELEKAKELAQTIDEFYRDVNLLFIYKRFYWGGNHGKKLEQCDD